MQENVPVTVRLEPEERERLEAEARRRGVGAGELAREYVLAALEPTPAADERRRRTIEALDRLAALRAELQEAGYPSVDGVELARQVREELNERPHL